MSEHMSQTCPKMSENMSEKLPNIYPKHVRKCPKNVRKCVPNMSKNVRKPWKNTIKSHFRPCPESNPVPSGSDSGAGSVSNPTGLIPSQQSRSPGLSYVSELETHVLRVRLVFFKIPKKWLFEKKLYATGQIFNQKQPIFSQKCSLVPKPIFCREGAVQYCTCVPLYLSRGTHPHEYVDPCLKADRREGFPAFLRYF
jgi:hypothetical protein